MEKLTKYYGNSKETNQLPLTFQRRVLKPPEDRCRPIRLIAVRVVREASEPLHVNEIRRQTLLYIKHKKRVGTWEQGVPGHNTVERRINECADPRLWDDGPPPLIHVGDCKSPLYALNPDRFPEVTEP